MQLKQDYLHGGTLNGNLDLTFFITVCPTLF